MLQNHGTASKPNRQDKYKKCGIYNTQTEHGQNYELVSFLDFLDPDLTTYLIIANFKT